MPPLSSPVALLLLGVPSASTMAAPSTFPQSPETAAIKATVAVRTLPSSLPLSSPFIGDLDARTSHWLDVLRCHKLSINDSVDLALSRLDSSLVTTMTPAFLLHQGKTRWPGPLSEAPHSAALLWVHACLACVPPSVSALASLPCRLGQPSFCHTMLVIPPPQL
jgi:hypothetical protein